MAEPTCVTLGEFHQTHFSFTLSFDTFLPREIFTNWRNLLYHIYDGKFISRFLCLYAVP